MNGPARKGNVWQRGIMGEVAWGSIKRRDSYFAAQVHRITRRRGHQQAAVGDGHRLLGIIYHVLRDRRPYLELGPGYFDTLDAARIERHHVRRLEQLGYAVELRPKATRRRAPSSRWSECFSGEPSENSQAQPLHDDGASCDCMITCAGPPVPALPRMCR